MSHSKALRMKMRLTSDRLNQAAQVFWEHPDLADLYLEFMFLLHSSMRTSVPLMEAALEESKGSADSDALSAGLVKYFTQHIPEEIHHDEWLLEDFEDLGIPRAAVEARIPSPTIADLTGSQYYWIHHYHPVALLGYIAVIEGNPPTLEHIDLVKKKTGIPDAAFRTYIKHAHLDPHHRDDLDRTLDELPLTTHQASLVGISAIRTVHTLARAFEEMVAVHEEAKSSGTRHVAFQVRA